jgi:hypothetical protein
MSNRFRQQVKALGVSYHTARILTMSMVFLSTGLGITNQTWAKRVDVDPPPMPPTVANGKTIIRFNSKKLLEPPVSMQNVSVAKTPPVVDFLYYPGQDYEGKPWSNRGDGVAVPGKYNSSIGDNEAPYGNAFVYEKVFIILFSPW